MVDITVATRISYGISMDYVTVQNDGTTSVARLKMAGIVSKTVFPAFSPKDLGCQSGAASSPAVGNPCSPATGNKYLSEQDFSGGDGVPSFIRHYNSLMNYSLLSYGEVGLGVGWTSTHHKHIRFVTANPSSTSGPTTGSTILLRRGNGRGERFVLNAGQWQGDADTKLVLTQDTTGYIVTFTDGAEERYDADGRLLSETDRAGKTTTYAYNADGQLAAVTGPFGHTLSFTYDASGHVSTVTDPAGQPITYSYDASNNLTRVTYPDGRYKTYHYENASFPNHLTGITDENGVRFATYAYDSNGKAVSTEHAQTDNGSPQERFTLTYNSDSQTTVTDPAGTQEVMTFQTILDVKKLAGKVNQTDGKTLAHTWDVNGNLTCRKDEEGRVTTYAYNASNQRTSVTEGLSGDCASPVTTSATRTTTYQYLSADLDLPTVIQGPSVYTGAQKQVAIAYDANLNPIQITQSGYTPSGAAVSRTVTLQYNSVGQATQIDGPRTDVSDVTTVEYYSCATGGACGQLARITNALGHATTFDSYDAAGRPLQTTDPNGLRITYAYDQRGRVTSVTQTPPGGPSRQTAFAYDYAGQLATATFPDGVVLTHTYDAAHYLRTITDNLGNKVEYKYDLKGNRTQTLTKDPDGTLVRSRDTAWDIRNRVSQINAGGSLTQLVWDAVGNLTSVTDPKSNPPTTSQHDPLSRVIQTVDALSGQTSTAWDVSSRLKQVGAPNSATTQYTSDDLGNLLSEASPDRGTTATTHDAAGNVVSKTDARGITVTYTYDALGRLTTIDYPGTAEDVTLAWDTETGCTSGIGRLCSVQDPSGATQYAYDAYGNLTQQTHTELGVTYTTRYTYDTGNRLTSITYPSGRVVTMSRDAVGRVSGVSATVNGVSTPLLSSRTYRADGLFTTQFFGNGLAETRMYDLQGRLTPQQTIGSETWTYTYDANGNLTSRTTSTQSAIYVYDALDRLTETSGSEWLTYDSNGNRLRLTYQGPADIVVDNTQATFTGTWPTSTAIAGYYDINYRTNANGTGTDKAVWKPKVVLAGNYYVYARWVAASTHASNAPYTIKYNGGSATVSKDQRTSGGAWVLLGTYSFAAGTGGTITLTDNANGTVIADAVKLRPVTVGIASEQYTYTPASNRLLSTGSGAVAHDAAGNQTSDKGGVRTFTYDNAGRLTQILSSSTVLGTYTYNFLGLRTRKVTASSTVVYHYDYRGRLLGEYTQAGSLIREYIWAAGAPLAQIDLTTTEAARYLHTDHLNTPRLATNSSGAVVWRWEGKAFGDTAPTGSATVNLRFPGQYYDSETGLHYNWNRYYDPKTGRYITSDPIGLASGVNTYGYVGANPGRFSDPSGLLETWEPGSWDDEHVVGPAANYSYSYYPGRLPGAGVVISPSGSMVHGGFGRTKGGRYDPTTDKFPVPQGDTCGGYRLFSGLRITASITPIPGVPVSGGGVWYEGRAWTRNSGWQPFSGGTYVVQYATYELPHPAAIKPPSEVIKNWRNLRKGRLHEGPFKGSISYAFGWARNEPCGCGEFGEASYNFLSDFRDALADELRGSEPPLALIEEGPLPVY